MAAVPLRLSGPATITTSAATVFTVPTGHKYRILQIHVMNAIAATQRVAYSVGAMATATQLFSATAGPGIAGGDVRTFNTDLTLVAGEILQAQTQSGNATLTVMGLDIVL